MSIEAIYALYPQVVIVRGNEAFEAFDIDGNQVEIDESAVETKAAELQAAHDAQQYSRDRATEYPSIGDQLDALFHAGVFPADMAAAIQAVKDKYPKGDA